MDSFPDELLLEVFSWLQDGTTLLDCVSLVCRRWCALAREPRAWRSVRVEYDCPLWSWPVPQHANRELIEGVSMDNARVLLHAPAIRHLSWGWWCMGPHVNRPQAIALSAVRRSRAVIREVYLGGVSFMAEPAWAVLSGLLWRNRDHIIDLTTELPDEWEESEEGQQEAAATEESYKFDSSLEEDQSDVVAAWAEEDGYPASLLDVLVQLRRLERLVLECNWGIPYAAELQVAVELLPSLRYLELNMRDHEVMLDLVRGTAARLHCLRMPDEYWLGFPGSPAADLPPALLATLSRCVQLRSLAANLMHVACVINMPRLHRLELWLSSQELRPQDVAERVRLLVQHSECLAGLRHLSLHLGSSVDPPMWETARASVASLLLAVASAARNVTKAKIHLDAAFEDLVPELLGCWPRLETVRLCWHGHKDHVQALAALPNLRRVTGWSWSGNSPLNAAMVSANLKTALPGIEVKIY